MRARRLDVPVVLASATPSLESVHNADQGRYRKLEMPRRIGSAGVPKLRIVDLKHHASRQALSTPLVAAIGEHLAAGNQVLLFLNRRGFAPALFCPGCKDAVECSRCDARLTVHAKAGELRCHHCGAQRTLEWACPTCGSERIAVGAGTQRVDEELGALFPKARIARLDRDVTSRKGALAAVLDDVASGRTEILIGTQMLTKGHDFPRVTLVGVLNADQGLFGTDPRSHERLAQTILQVAGRAGRAERPGEVVIQTHYPEHPLLACLLAQDYAAFAALALAERRDSQWPPFSHLAAWRAEAAQREPAFALLNRVRGIATRLQKEVEGEVAILGPAPQPMERKDGRYRAQLLFQSAQRAPLHELLRQTLPELRARRGDAQSALESRRRSARALENARLRARPRWSRIQRFRWRAAIAIRERKTPHRAGCGCCSAWRSGSSSRPACISARCRPRRAPPPRPRPLRPPHRRPRPRRPAIAVKHAARKARGCRGRGNERAAFRLLRDPAAVRGRRARGRDGREPGRSLATRRRGAGQLRAAGRLVQRARRRGSPEGAGSRCSASSRGSSA